MFLAAELSIQSEGTKAKIKGALKSMEKGDSELYFYSPNSQVKTLDRNIEEIRKRHKQRGAKKPRRRRQPITWEPSFEISRERETLSNDQSWSRASDNRFQFEPIKVSPQFNEPSEVKTQDGRKSPIDPTDAFLSKLQFPERKKPINPSDRFLSKIDLKKNSLFHTPQENNGEEKNLEVEELNLENVSGLNQFNSNKPFFQKKNTCTY